MGVAMQGFFNEIIAHARQTVKSRRVVGEAKAVYNFFKLKWEDGDACAHVQLGIPS